MRVEYIKAGLMICPLSDASLYCSRGVTSKTIPWTCIYVYQPTTTHEPLPRDTPQAGISNGYTHE